MATPPFSQKKSTLNMNVKTILEVYFNDVSYFMNVPRLETQIEIQTQQKGFSVWHTIPQ